ncbi:hypothetical protein HL667_00060 [Bradyrhizobium sp. 83012]|uniref:Transposase n=1 Tax=Bradyrhizobium aeschynomenes TaxID=2734909 RepID=A0ABX2C507_9BRAD|nr:hypothetical protein [Bradyrhizobium aeschynomenes]NPU63389.1 hypothetical protein [Bradyrhizobium aeschynomenes]
MREHNDRAWAAYQTAYLPRIKRPPPLRRLQIQPRGARKSPQSWQHMKSIAHMMTLALGGEVTARSASGPDGQ